MAKKNTRKALFRLLKALNSSETYVAVAGGLLIGLLWPRLDFVPDSIFLLAVFTFFFGLTTLIEATKLSTFDRLLDTELGKMVRKKDPMQEDALIMFSIGRYVAVLAALFSIVAYITVHSIDGWGLPAATGTAIEATIVAVAGGLILWMVGAYLSLKHRQDYFIRRISYVRSLNERRDDTTQQQDSTVRFLKQRRSV